jgi:hypothetical protein
MNEEMKLKIATVIALTEKHLKSIVEIKVD